MQSLIAEDTGMKGEMAGLEGKLELNSASLALNGVCPHCYCLLAGISEKNNEYKLCLVH